MHRRSKPREPYRSTTPGSGSAPSLQVVCACSSASSAPVRDSPHASIVVERIGAAGRKVVYFQGRSRGFGGVSLADTSPDPPKCGDIVLARSSRGRRRPVRPRLRPGEPRRTVAGRPRAATPSSPLASFESNSQAALKRKAPISPKTMHRARCPRMPTPVAALSSAWLISSCFSFSLNLHVTAR